MRLTIPSRFLYIGLLVLATEHDNRIYNDPTWIGQLLDIPPTEVNLKPLYREGFLQASNMHRVLREREGEREGDGERDGARVEDAPPQPSGLPRTEKKRPTPLPTDFVFTKELKEWALEEGCKEPFREFEQFTDKARAKGWTYIDWTAAFKNWIRNAVKWAEERRHA